MEHVGSAHDERALEALKDDAAQRLASGQQELQVDLEMGSGMQPVTSDAVDAAGSSNSRQALDTGCAETADADRAARDERPGAGDLLEHVAA